MTNTQEKPHNTKAEQVVLGTILLDNSTISIVKEMLSEKDFYFPAHRDIFKAMIELIDEGTPVELTLLSELLERHSQLEEIGGPAYLASLLAVVVSPRIVKSYCEVVKRKSVCRQYMDLSIKTYKLAQSEAPLPELLKMLDDNMISISNQMSHTKIQPIQKSIEDYEANINKILESGKDERALFTGYKEMDRKIGGFYPGEYVLIPAKSGTGKSAFLVNLILHMTQAQNKRGLFFSAEMKTHAIISRKISNMIGESTRKIQAPLTWEEQDAKNIKWAMKEINKLPLITDDTPNIDIADLKARACRAKNENPDLAWIAIDYLQYISCKEERKKLDAEKRISNELVGIAKNLNVVVIALCQLRKKNSQHQSVDSYPTNDDIIGSSQCAMDADFILFLQTVRDEIATSKEGFPIYNTRRPGKQQAIRWLNTKTRNGDTFNMGRLIYTGEHMSFQEV